MARKWGLVQIGPNSHPRKVVRWWRWIGLDMALIVANARSHGKYSSLTHLHPRSLRAKGEDRREASPLVSASPVSPPSAASNPFDRLRNHAKTS